MVSGTYGGEAARACDGGVEPGELRDAPGRSPRKPRRLVALQRQGEGLRWEHTPWGFLLGQAAALFTDVIGSALDLVLPAPLPGGDLAC